MSHSEALSYVQQMTQAGCQAASVHCCLSLPRHLQLKHQGYENCSIGLPCVLSQLTPHTAPCSAIQSLKFAFLVLNSNISLPLDAGSNHPALPQEGLPRHQPQPVHPESRSPLHLPARLYTDRLLIPRQHSNRLARQETLTQTLAQLSLASCRSLKAMCLLLLMGRQRPAVLIAKLTAKREWKAQIKRDLVRSVLTVAKC